MQDLLVQIQSICAKPEDIVLITFGKDMNLDECNNIIEYLNKKFPEFRFVGNIEGCIKNITVLDAPVKPIFHFDWSESKDGD